MKRVNGAELKVSVQGAGLPVLLVHGGILADGLAGLLQEPALASRYRLIHFHRRGYGGSARAIPPFTLADQAQDCLAILEHTGAESAHVVGHSFGGLIALQLAIDAPERVRSLTLIEPSLLGFIPSAPQIFEVFAALGQMYQAGDKQGAVHHWMLPISGPNYRETLDRVLPNGWFQQAVTDIDTAFQVDVAALQGWRFGPEEAQRIQAPVLSVVGTDHTLTFAQEIDALLHVWFPQVETLVVPQSMHWPQLTNPSALAAGLVQFFARSEERGASKP